MATLAALLQTLGGVGSNAATAKQELSAEALKKKQVYDQLESAALQRAHLRKIIEQMSANPQSKAKADIEGALGRKLTDVESQRLFGVAPKEVAPKVSTKLVQDPDSKTGWSFVSYDPLSGQEYSRQLDAPPQRGLIESETDSQTTDPLTGLTSHTKSVRKPILGPPAGGAKSTGGKPVPSSATGPLAALAPVAQAKPQLAGKLSTAGPLAKKPAASGAPSASAPLPLDAEGHIPAGTFLNPQVREAANELLDGQDKLKIQPSKLADVAANVARRYGWEQGKFTPKEQTMLRETTTFIQRAMSDDSMKALDEGMLSRMRLQQVAQNPDKEGMIGRTFSLAASSGMSDSQKKFIQTYNQLVGVIAGLSQLVRSGRATEATIERLKAELPNPTTTRDAKDAHERLQRVMDEINVAMRKGTFTGQDSGGGAPSPDDIIKKALTSPTRGRG